MIKALVLIAATFPCCSVIAQANNFQGLSGALNVNTVSVNSKLSGSSGSIFDGFGQQSWNGSAQAAYGFATSPNSIVSIGGTYALGNSKGGSGGDGILEIQVKNAYSLYLEPGLRLNNRTLAYAKISYEGANGVLAVGGVEQSKSMYGNSYGVGFRTMLNKISFAQVEFKQISYGSFDVLDTGSLKPSATVGTFGIGLKF